MIVESIDHRKPSSESASNEPECVRVVLQPNGESFYADLCLLNAKHGNTWTDQEVLEVESKILVTPEPVSSAQRLMNDRRTRPARLFVWSRI